MVSGLELHRQEEQQQHKRKVSETERKTRQACYLSITNSISLAPLHMNYLRPCGYVYSFPAFLIKTISQGLQQHSDSQWVVCNMISFLSLPHSCYCCSDFPLKGVWVQWITTVSVYEINTFWLPNSVFDNILRALSYSMATTNDLGHGSFWSGRNSMICNSRAVSPHYGSCRSRD